MTPTWHSLEDKDGRRFLAGFRRQRRVALRGVAKGPTGTRRTNVGKGIVGYRRK